MTRVLLYLIENKIVRRISAIVGILFLVRVCLFQDDFATTAMAIMAIGAVILMGSILLVIFAFMIYHGVRHGDPTMDYDAEPVVVTHIEQRVKKEKRWCPMCKANTGCRVRQNPYTKTWVHVMR